MDKIDFLVAGGGIIGLSVALELRNRNPRASIIVIEKEDRPGLHASTRNSGVIHAGFYYSPDSLKARMTRQGNEDWTEFCASKKLGIDRCGKLVVAKREDELPQLDKLLQRGQLNGVPLELVDEKTALEIEPRAKTFHRALWSPSTSTVDPEEMMKQIISDCGNQGITIRSNEAFLNYYHETIYTSRGSYSVGHFINACGLYADKVSHTFGFGKDHFLLPFKGLYLINDKTPSFLSRHIYPVPHPKQPFLGVHFTRTFKGFLKIGPTAIPALWRENYLGFGGFRFNEFAETLRGNAAMLVGSKAEFRSLIIEETRKYSKSNLLKAAQSMTREFSGGPDYRWGKPGIRAQLVRKDSLEFEMDFVIEGDNRTTHILNAVSPAFTCAFPFARFVCDRIGSGLGPKQ